MKAGAADYLSKGTLTHDSIARAIRHTLALRAEEQQRRHAEAARRALRSAGRTWLTVPTWYL
jgi:FixJ family two-component response regulator